jgi:hypothetical protein
MSESVNIQTWYDLIYKMAKDWGFPTALSCALIWVGYQEHKHQTEVLTEAQTYIRDRLTSVIEKNTTSQTELKQSVEELNNAIEDLNPRTRIISQPFTREE